MKTVKQGHGAHRGGLSYIDRLVFDFVAANPGITKAEVERTVRYIQMSFCLGQESEKAKHKDNEPKPPRVGRAKRPICSIDEYGNRERFNSIYEACKVVGVTYGAVNMALRKGTKCNKLRWVDAK
jgi:hypothetical protein